MYDAFVCPVCLGSFVIPDENDPDCWCECLNCSQLAPLWYLRLMGIHECERDDYVPAWERLTSVPITLADGSEYGKSRNPADYADFSAELRQMAADGFEWVPNIKMEHYFDREQAERLAAMTPAEKAAHFGVPVEWFRADGYLDLANHEAAIMDFLKARLSRGFQ